MNPPQLICHIYIRIVWCRDLSQDANKQYIVREERRTPLRSWTHGHVWTKQLWGKGQKNIISLLLLLPSIFRYLLFENCCHCWLGECVECRTQNLFIQFQALSTLLSCRGKIWKVGSFSQKPVYFVWIHYHARHCILCLIQKSIFYLLQVISVFVAL